MNNKFLLVILLLLIEFIQNKLNTIGFISFLFSDFFIRIWLQHFLFAGNIADIMKL